MASLNIDDKTAESLRRRAFEAGMSLEDFVRHLLSREASIPVKQTRLTVEEFDSILDREATDTPGLPSNFSRADIYCDHD